jgi:hypothetical protein
VSALRSSPAWQSLPRPPIVDVLYEDEEIEDVVALSGAATPEWLKTLSIPTDWQLLELPEGPEQPLARMIVSGPLGGGEWKAADIIEVSGFTGWPQFYDVFRNADRLLRGLNASGVSVKALLVPPIQWTAAVRSSGTALVGTQDVWIQQSNYVAGSDHPRASRLIVHTTLVNAESREQLTQSVSHLTADVYGRFINALTRNQGAR